MMIKGRFLALMLILAVPLAWGASLPGYYPKPLPATATIDRVDTSHRRVIMNDSVYWLSDGVIIHTPHQKFAPVSTLSKGQRATYRFIYGAGQHKLLTEIWILPSSYGLSEE